MWLGRPPKKTPSGGQRARCQSTPTFNRWPGGGRTVIGRGSRRNITETQEGNASRRRLWSMSNPKGRSDKTGLRNMLWTFRRCLAPWQGSRRDGAARNTHRAKAWKGDAASPQGCPKALATRERAQCFLFLTSVVCNNQEIFQPRPNYQFRTVYNEFSEVNPSQRDTGQVSHAPSG